MEIYVEKETTVVILEALLRGDGDRRVDIKAIDAGDRKAARGADSAAGPRKLLPVMPVESTLAYYRLNRRDISFLRFVLEACDGIGFARTVDPRSGLVAVHMPPGCAAEVRAVISGLRESICIEPVVGPDEDAGERRVEDLTFPSFDFGRRPSGEGPRGTYAAQDILHPHHRLSDEPP